MVAVDPSAHIDRLARGWTRAKGSRLGPHVTNPEPSKALTHEVGVVRQAAKIFATQLPCHRLQ